MGRIRATDLSFFFLTWNVFIQIETVALKAVGLPEEGTLRIGGKRVRLHICMHVYMYVYHSLPATLI